MTYFTTALDKMHGITYETFTSQYDNDKVMFFKYDYKKYDYSDELYWDKDNYKYEWFKLVIKEYKLKLGTKYWFDHKHNGDGGFMFWKKKKRYICNDFKICRQGHLWKQKFSKTTLSKCCYVLVKKNILKL